MTTELKKFEDAYATMVVASYEPLFLRWFSGYGISIMANVMAYRLPVTAMMKQHEGVAPAGQLDLVGNAGKLILPSTELMKNLGAGSSGKEVNPIDDMIENPKAAKVEGFPDAKQIGSTIQFSGLKEVKFGAGARAPAELRQAPDAGFLRRTADFLKGKSQQMAQRMVAAKRPTFADQIPVPLVRGRGNAVLPDDFDVKTEKMALMKNMASTIDNWLAADDGSSLDNILAKNIDDAFLFWPGQVEEALSPIGIAHFYRQLFFNTSEGFGPIEQCFTVAPAETLEVIYENVRKQSFEEIVEVGEETVSETAIEQKNLDEVSDKAASMLQNDASVAISANFGVQTPVYQLGGSASASFSTSSQRSRERTTKSLKEVTTRASERIQKSFTIKTRSFEETTTTNTTRRVIANPGEDPVNYGLRRVLRKVHVKMQDLGPRLVWQLYISNPGEGLARSRFVHFREAGDIAVPEIPPGVPPIPEGGIDSGTTSSSLAWSSSRSTYYVRLVITAPAGRLITAVSIDSITDLEGGGKNDLAPSPKNDVQWGDGWDEATNTYTMNVAILPGDAASVSVSYTYAWDPSQDVMDAWETKRQEAYNALKEEMLTEQFERQKTLLTEQSKIRPRAAKALREEERYEVMNRMISHLFAQPSNPSQPSPLELETFHKYFDIHGIFTYMHPSWWKPRFSVAVTGYAREAYPITAESEPAPIGASLGWLMQLDGDDRRNEFLNSPWIRVCIPMKPATERQAIRWLATYIEGERGYDDQSGVLKKLIADIEKRRDDETKAADGPDYAVVSADPGAPDSGLKPQDVFPIINQYDVTVPTDGFIYDRLVIQED
jgi:hypothetical protein